jgi:hypothetical protein
MAMTADRKAAGSTNRSMRWPPSRSAALAVADVLDAWLEMNISTWAASTPMAAALALKGLSPGAALVFLLAGPATNIGSVVVLLKVLGIPDDWVEWFRAAVRPGTATLALLVSDIPFALAAGVVALAGCVTDKEHKEAADLTPLLAAAADVDVGDLLGLEADRLDLDDVLAGGQAFDGRLALLVRRGALRFGAGRGVGGDDRDRGADDGGAGLIEDHHLDAAGVRIRLLLRRGGGPGSGSRRGLRVRVLCRDRRGGERGKGCDGEQPQEPGRGRHDQLLVLRLNCSSSNFGLALAFFSSHSSVGLSPVCTVM